MADILRVKSTLASNVRRSSDGSLALAGGAKIIRLSDGVPALNDYIANHQEAGAYAVYKSKTGKSWAKQSWTAATPLETAAHQVMNKQLLMTNAAGSAADIYRSLDNGKTWAFLETALASEFFMTVDNYSSNGASKNSGLKVYYKIGGGAYVHVYTTTDGSSWVLTLNQAERPANLLYAGNGIFLLLMSSIFGGKIWRSIDGGANWSAVTGMLDGSTFYGCDVNQGRGWVLASSTAANAKCSISLDRGANWYQSTTVLAGGNNWYSPCCQDAQIWLYSLTSGTTDIMRSTDFGVTWAPIAFPGANYAVRIMRTKSGNFLALEQGNAKIYRSTDRGLSWALVYTSPDGPGDISILGSLDGGKTFVGSIAGLQWVYISTDEGATWTRNDAGVALSFIIPLFKPS